MQASNPFMISVPSFFDSMGQGYAQQAAIRDDQQRQLAMQAQAEAQQKMAQEAYELSRNPNATAHDYAGFMMRNPAMAENAKKAFEVMSPEQKANQLAEGSQVLSSLLSGRSDVAISKLEQSRQAAINAGDQARADAIGAQIERINQDPRGAVFGTAGTLAAIQGAENFAANFGSMLEQYGKSMTLDADVATANAEAATKSTEAAYRGAQIEQDLAQGSQKMIIDQERLNLDAARLGLDQARLNADAQAALAKSEKELGQLDVEGRKQVAEAATSYSVQNAAAGKALQLAAQFDAMPAEMAGWSTRPDSELEELARTAQEVARFTTLAEFKKVAGGNLSDSDREMVLKGMPSKNADNKTWARYMRALGNAAKVSAQMEDAKVAWLSANGGSAGDAPRDIVARGIAVPKGMSLAEFQRHYIANQNSAPQASSGERPYMRYGQGR